MQRWSVLVDEATLEEMALLPMSHIGGHAENLISSRPTYRNLYRAWDRQQWSSEGLRLDQDAEEWSRLSAGTRRRLERVIQHFLVSEYAATETMAPIMTGAPDETALLFLGGQAADEARHARLMDRIGSEVLGVHEEDLRQALTLSWQHSTPAQRAYVGMEGRIVRQLDSPQAGLTDWLQAVALFHVVAEGVMGVTAQRNLLSALKSSDTLQGVRAGFTALTRDESRHIAFGVEAVRRGLANAPQERVDAVAHTLREALAMVAVVELPTEPTRSERILAWKFGRQLQAEAEVRLRALGIRPEVNQWIRDGMAAPLDGLRRQIRHAGAQHA
ncbi:ribonucleotide-diphosphate reductase subunit beta [Streptomyces sp. NPDC044984]|uniref:ribonucleotide-diphosphate reductase subunit beta n=1 Tax=Streptomyces sp. NPDC044984 TaxID=3154335 RepID=UPI0033D5AC0D